MRRTALLLELISAAIFPLGLFLFVFIAWPSLVDFANSGFKFDAPYLELQKDESIKVIRKNPLNTDHVKYGAIYCLIAWGVGLIGYGVSWVVDGFAKDAVGNIDEY